MSVVIPDEILQAADLSASELKREIALLLCQRGKLDVTVASDFAELAPTELQQLLQARVGNGGAIATVPAIAAEPSSQAEILREIEQTRQFCPADSGLPDTLTLIRADRERE